VTFCPPGSDGLSFVFLKLLLISKTFAPDSIFGRDRCGQGHRENTPIGYLLDIVKLAHGLSVKPAKLIEPIR
jgi:hypothetical protein